MFPALKCILAACVAAAVLGEAARAASYLLPAPGESIIGDLQQVAASETDTLVEISRRHGLGYEELVLANPGVDRWLPGAGTSVLLPTRYILPRAPRVGIVVNIAEMRLYYFAPAKGKTPAQVVTYPVGVGRDDWKTPETATSISAKLTDPAWYPPRAIRKEHAARGDHLPAIVPAGPNNPLGRHVLKLAIGGGYYIHGTSQMYGIGMPVTHGCLRLYPEDVEELFKQVPVGTPVRIVNQPYKSAWRGGVLYIEAHPDVAHDDPPDFKGLDTYLRAALRRRQSYPVDWPGVQGVALHPRGVPMPVPIIIDATRG